LVSVLCALLMASTGAGSAISVRGETTCPTASEVSAALSGLVTPPAPPAAPDVVELSRHGASINVKLATAASEVVAEKRLPESLSCAERAQTAAVMVAAWEARLRGAVSPWPLPPPPAVTATARPPVAAATAPPPLAVREPMQIDTGAAVLASIAAGTASPAALVEATFSRRGSRFALSVGALAVGTHDVAVGSGRGSWRRWGGVIEARSLTGGRALELELHAGVALTALAVTGQSLPDPSGATIFDPGAIAGLRAFWRVGRVAPWLEASLASWPRAHGLYVRGTSLSADIPPFEGLLGVGVSLGQAP
jgi:hypothetical protein